MGAHLIDSVVHGHLWSTPEVRDLFTDEGRLQTWLEIIVALAEAQAELGLVPGDAADAIAAHARVDRLDLEAVAAETRATGHSTLGLIRCLQRALPEEAREWVYWGATVQDVSDTWFALTMQRVGAIASRDVRQLQVLALNLADRHRDTVMSGRTHGQPGLPISFGFKAAVWASELGRHLERLDEGRARWEVAQLGGALGTMEFWGERAIPLLEGFAARLGLGHPDVPWLTARDRLAEFGHVVAMIGATLGKIGNEIYQLQRPEIGELREAFTPGQVGSITMPHKRNPELAEHLVTLARLSRASSGVLLEGMIQEHERDGRGWKAEWIALPEVCLFGGAALSFCTDLLAGLEVDAPRMLANVEARGGYLASEPVMRALADRVGKHRAHQMVYEAAMSGVDRGVDFHDALQDSAMTASITSEEVRSLSDPRRALGASGDFIDRACGRRPT